MIRNQGDRAERFVVGKGSIEFPREDIPYSCDCIVARRYDSTAVVAEPRAKDFFRMRENMESLPRGCVPHSRGPVVTDRHKPLSVRRKAGALTTILMAVECFFELTAVCVPQAGRIVHSDSQNRVPIGTQQR